MRVRRFALRTIEKVPVQYIARIVVMSMFFGQAANHIDRWFHGTDGEEHIVECAYTIAWR